MSNDEVVCPVCEKSLDGMRGFFSHFPSAHPGEDYEKYKKKVDNGKHQEKIKNESKNTEKEVETKWQKKNPRKKAEGKVEKIKKHSKERIRSIKEKAEK